MKNFDEIRDILLSHHFKETSHIDGPGFGDLEALFCGDSDKIRVLFDRGQSFIDLMYNGKWVDINDISEPQVTNKIFNILIALK